MYALYEVLHPAGAPGIKTKLIAANKHRGFHLLPVRNLAINSMSKGTLSLLGDELLISFQLDREKNHYFC